MRKTKKVSITLILILVLYFFRYLFSNLIPLGEYLYVFVTIIYTTYLIFKTKINYIIGYIIFLDSIFILIYILSYVRGINPLISTTSLLNYTLFINFWGLYFNKNVHKLDEIIKILVNFVFIISIGAIIQFFVDPNLFGLIDYSIYSDEDNLSKVVFSKRAISIIKSPQTLGFVLSFYILFISDKKNIMNLFAGILTFTKAFFVAVVLKYLLKFKIKSISISILILTSLVLTIYYFGEISGLERIYNFIFQFELSSQSERIDRWLYYLNQFNNFSDYFFGNGLGIGSRTNEILADNTLKFSSESFLIQLLSETGIIGFLSFIFPLVYLFIYKKNYRSKIIITILLLFISPAFYSFSANFLIIPLLILPFFQLKQKI